MNIEQKIICLMGPTACGKTQLAIDLVQQFPCDIISVDSAMVYRDMDIGTAKPSLQELHKAPHRLINICDPATPYSAGQFCVDARREIKSIHAQGRIPLLVGGTMLYFHLLQHGVAELPTADQAAREKISQQARENGWPVLHQQLKKIDPKIAAAIHPHDSQRIQRALEVYYTTGQTMSDIQNAQPLNALSYKNINIVVAYEERATLHRKIAQRFAQMLEDGFIAADSASILTLDKKVLGIELHSGRNRIVRRIFQHLGYEVERLDRTLFAGLSKERLPRGKWRHLTDKEVIKLKFFTGKKQKHLI